MQTILLVEDDPEITRLLDLHLDAEQYQLTCCATGGEALQTISAENYHLIMLDISLPDSNGIELCKKIRASDLKTPIMMLTCHAEECDKVLALGLGADDYVTKPFGIMELMARVKAIMRRSNYIPEPVTKKEIIYADLSIDAEKRKVLLKNDRVELTVKEFDLLWLLASNPGKIFTRKELLEKVWGFAFAGYEHTVTSHINRLRLKLETDLTNPKYILTAWGSGYRFSRMKQRKQTIFRRFAIVISGLIAFLGFVFIIITYLSVTNYHQATTQLLNKDVAQHIAQFTTAFTTEGLNKKQADSVFQNAMVMNPNAEVYFLDSSGKIIYSEAADGQIKEQNISLAPVLEYIKKEGKVYIKGTDPKISGGKKIFSAAVVHTQNKSVGYIYVVLGSEKSAGIMGLLFGSHIINLAVKGFIIVIILSFIFSFWYLKRIRKNFREADEVLHRFENGDYDARFEAKNGNNLELVPHAFNKMADLLSSSINKLTKTEQERKDFIATISHDLRTPLSIARGYVETVQLKKEKGTLTTAEEKEYLQLIHGKILHIEKMAKQLFELSRMEAAAFIPQKEPFVLSEIVQEAVNTFQIIAQQKNITLKCTQCLYHVWVNADISMMERVLQNLIENAIKETPAGGSIQTGLTVEANKLIFVIENNGTSLPADLLQWINNYKLSDTVSYKRSWKSGLGLVIVQKILHLHETVLEAQVTEKGSNTFSFRLPIFSLPA